MHLQGQDYFDVFSSKLKYKESLHGCADIDTDNIAYKLHSHKFLKYTNFYQDRSSCSWVITQQSLAWMFVRDELRNCGTDFNQIL